MKSLKLLILLISSLWLLSGASFLGGSSCNCPAPTACPPTPTCSAPVPAPAPSAPILPSSSGSNSNLCSLCNIAGNSGGSLNSASIETGCGSSAGGPIYQSSSNVQESNGAPSNVQVTINVVGGSINGVGGSSGTPVGGSGCGSSGNAPSQPSSPIVYPPPVTNINPSSLPGYAIASQQVHGQNNAPEGLINNHAIPQPITNIDSNIGYALPSNNRLEVDPSHVQSEGYVQGHAAGDLLQEVEEYDSHFEGNAGEEDNKVQDLSLSPQDERQDELLGQPEIHDASKAEIASRLEHSLDEQQEIMNIMHQNPPTILANNITMSYTDDTHISFQKSEDCNNEELGKLILENIDEDLNAAKRSIQNAAEERFGGGFNVICASNDFTYLVNTELYCQRNAGPVSCYAFKQVEESR